MRGHVEVAGGGIAGLTAGLAFAREGWSVRVHEQDETLRIPGAGIYIWENGLRVLDTLGVLDAVRAGAIPATRHEKRDHDGQAFATGGFAPDFRLIVPERRTLLTALAGALREAGGEVVFGSRPVKALPEGRLIFENGAEARADLVIGADGINSRIRDSLDLLAWRVPARQFGYRVMIPRRPEELTTAMGQAHCENWNGSRRLLYAPCTTDLAYVQLTSVAGDVSANRVPIDRALWRALFPRHHWIIDRVPDNGHGDWFEILKLKQWSKGRVAVLGDAASAQPPFLGQGGGCAMMSALSLAHMVARESDVERGIAAWTRRERRFTEWVQTVSYWYGQLAFLPPVLRNAAFRAIGASDALKGRTLLVAARRMPTGTRGASPRLADDGRREAYKRWWPLGWAAVRASNRRTAMSSAVSIESRIPIIDVGAFLAGERGAARRLADEVARTCLDTGFLVIANHGVAQSIVDRAFEAAAEFFALDEESKLALKVGAQNIGYLPYGGQTVRTSTVHKNTKPNFSESFYITTPDPDGDHDRNQWPPGMDAFKAAQISYFQIMRDLAHRVLPAFALALDLPEDYFESDFTGASCTVRLIEYAPQLHDEADLFGFAPHTDGSLITFLPRSRFPGLEVRTSSGEWIRPPSIPGTFVVNTGEMLAHYSNDRFVPTPHRVINRSPEKRHAMPFFYGPNRHKVISCVPTCVSESNPPRYQPSTSFERGAIKDKLNFPHRQKPEFASESY